MRATCVNDSVGWAGCADHGVTGGRAGAGGLVRLERELRPHPQPTSGWGMRQDLHLGQPLVVSLGTWLVCKQQREKLS